VGGSGRLEKVGGTRGLAPFNRVGVRRKRSRVRPCRTTPRRAAGQLDWLMVMADRSRVPQPTNQRARAIVSSETATLPSAHRPLAPHSWVCAFMFYSIFLVLRRFCWCSLCSISASADGRLNWTRRDVRGISRRARASGFNELGKLVDSTL